MDDTRVEIRPPVNVVVPPSPDEIALRFAASMLASGRYGDDFGAALSAAWYATAQFYVTRATVWPDAFALFLVPKTDMAPGAPEMAQDGP